MAIRAGWAANMRWHRLLVVSGLCLTLAACNSGDTLSSVSNKVEHPLPTKVVNRMKAYDMTEASPIMMRIFKEESVLEVWKAKANGRYEKIAEYEICKWSGELGPKRAEGDRQAPEGFYTVNRHQMNPNSSYYLSFNLGYPNRFDRAHGRTGTNLMVHGACSSAGCYSMTDEQVLEIYAFAREAFKGGQESFQVQALPFRMTAENMARHRDNPNYEFWKMLKVGYDHFELTKTPPKVDVCNKEYVFNQVPTEPNAVFDASAACPTMSTPESLQVAYQTYVQDYEAAFQEALQKQLGQKPGRSGALSRLLPTNQSTPASAAAASAAATAAPAAPAVAAPAVVAPAAASAPVAAEAAQPASVTVPAEASAPTAATPVSTTALPVPVANPLGTSTSLYAAPPPAPAEQVAERPRWSLWGRN
jgi:murein L,D-transpeptidase YafK